MSLTFAKSRRTDLKQLMVWFPDAHATRIWGGPGFRYPFTRKTFREDCRWRDFSSYSLKSPTGKLVAFGQLGSRFERSHLARLVSHPEFRGQGLGKRLISHLLDTIKQEHLSTECGLFVYKDNEPAYHCYLSLGFEIYDYPDGAPMRDLCHYMTFDLRKLG